MSQFPSTEKVKFRIDIGLLIILICFMILSVVAIRFAAPIVTNGTNAYSYWIRQTVWYAIGFAVLFLCVKLGTDQFYLGVKAVYWILNGLLALLLVDKYLVDLPWITAVQGTTAWFQIPGIGSFQPAEFMKIVLIILAGDIIAKHNEQKEDLSFSEDISLYFKLIRICILPLILILLEPETGIPLIIIVSITIMCILSGIRREWIIAGLVLIAILIFGFLYLYYNDYALLESLVGAGYRLNRFKGWLETEKYSSSYGYQLFQSLLALGSAGLTGHTWDTAVIYFSEPQTDFIFAVICQNFGFIGAFITVALCFLLDLKLLRIILNYPNKKEKYTLIGLVGMLIFQQMENMGMVLGLFPITGITLPFISYGGSSMLSYMIPLALAFQMSHENKIRTMH